MKHLTCFLVLFLISGVGSFDLVIDEIPDVSISRQGPGLPSSLISVSKLRLALLGAVLDHCFIALLVSLLPLAENKIVLITVFHLSFVVLVP